MRDPIHVCAAVLRDAQGRALLARRSAGKDLAGAWEFPGGKREAGESPEQALCRELREELGIEVAPECCAPLIRVPHAYPHKRILLDVYTIDRWHGEPRGHERQALAWAMPRQLPLYPMPAADLPVLAALNAPELYPISPPTVAPPRTFADALRTLLEAGARRLQLRIPDADSTTRREYAHLAADICHEYGAELLINADLELAAELGVGVHLRAAQLAEFTARPALPGCVAASCHDAGELRRAQALGLDFVVLGPVLPTASHPGLPGMGWQRFAQLREAVSLPIYAIGGLGPDDIAIARAHGAQGVAGIGKLWPHPDHVDRTIPDA